MIFKNKTRIELKFRCEIKEYIQLTGKKKKENILHSIHKIQQHVIQQKPIQKNKIVIIDKDTQTEWIPTC